MNQKPDEEGSETGSVSSTVQRFLRHLPLPDHAGFFEAFMENSPALAWIADEESRLYYMNRAYRETFDLGGDVLFQQPSFIRPEYLKIYQENNRKVVRENRVLETLEDGYDQHGAYRVFKVSKFPLGVHEGTPLVGGGMVDLTQELQTEKELRLTAERYHYASMATSDVIWEWDVTSETLFMGLGYEALVGYSSTSAINQLESHVHRDDLTRLKESIQSALSSRDLYWQMEYRYRCKNGDVKQVVNKAFIVRDDKGAPQRMIGALQDITTIRRLQGKLMTEQAKKEREMIAAAMEAQEKERNEIGRELHDNVNQLLATAKLLMTTAQDGITSHQALLKQSIGLIDQALNENRNLSHRLVVPSLDEEDFDIAIRDLAATLEKTQRIQVFVQLPALEEVKTMKAALRLHLYRILQEAVTNIVKYAAATQVSFSLGRSDKGWQMQIADDGVGFDKKQRKSGVGLKNITSRIELLGGTCRIIASPGNGCQLLMEIPDK